MRLDQQIVDLSSFIMKICILLGIYRIVEVVLSRSSILTLKSIAYVEARYRPMSSLGSSLMRAPAKKIENFFSNGKLEMCRTFPQRHVVLFNPSRRHEGVRP